MTANAIQLQVELVLTTTVHISFVPILKMEVQQLSIITKPFAREIPVRILLISHSKFVIVTAGHLSIYIAVMPGSLSGRKFN